MSRARTLILLGVLVGLSPFLGLPMWLLMWVLPILGLMVLLTGLSLRTRRMREEPQPPAPAPSFDIHEPTQGQ
ncbi:MAG: hypothetical protein AAB440_00590 [Patescibacteria group bacterium]